jgi:uncharacterized protein (DUF1330 family)
MKKGYWVVAYKSISDDSATKAYAELALPAVESFGGRFLTRSLFPFKLMVAHDLAAK